MTRVEVNTDRLAKAAPEFDRIADGLERVRQEIESKLYGVGDCWGDDKIGEAFLGNYQQPAKNLRDGLKVLVENLHSVRDGVHTISRGADRAERQAIELARPKTAAAPAEGA